MDQLWIITALVFTTTLLGAVAAHQLLFRTIKSNKAINRRLSDSVPKSRATATVSTPLGSKGLLDTDNPVLRHLNDLMLQTGLKMSAKQILLYLILLSTILFLAMGLFLGYGFISLFIALLGALSSTYLFFGFTRQRRIARFGEQLPDALDVIVRGVRVGYPLSVALRLVAREMPDPVGPEFAMAADEIAFGQDIKTAMDHLYRRVGQEDLFFLVVAITVQSQTGGNVAEVLSRLAQLMRNRTKVHLKIRALSAEGRVSAKFLSAMPLILFVVVCLVSPTYFADVRHSPFLMPALVYALTSLVLGNFLMYRLVNFKV